MLRSTEQDTGILRVERNIIGYDASNARDLLFIYERNEYSRKIIRQIYSYFQIVGYKVNLFICQKRNLFGYKRLFDPGVRIILFPELYQTDSGLIRLISDVLCEKGRHSARTLLLFKFPGAVLPSYLEFEDVISIDSNDWVEKLHSFVNNTKKTIARRNSIATCRNIFDHNGVKIKRYCSEITGNDSLSSSKLHDNGIVYIIRGTTETETDISKQISSLLSVATGFGCEQTSTADSSLALLPTHIRSASIQHHTCVVITFNSVFGSKSKASDYGILFREFENTAVLTLELCENKATSGSRPLFMDNKSGNVRLSGKYKDWYRVLLDAVGNVIDRTGRETVACTLFTTVDDSAIAVVPKLSKRASHRHAGMPTIVAPDTYSDNPNSYSGSSQSSHLSSTCWLQLGDGQESDIHHLSSEPSDASGSHASLSSRFTYSDGDTSTDADTASTYKSMFDLFDADNDGSITLDEVCSVVQNLGLGWEKESIQAEMKKVDKDENGMIEFDEFLIMMKSHKVDPDMEMKQMFSVIDKDGDGSITAEEIWIRWNRIGIPCTLGEVSIMIAAGDTDHNGVIDFEEFRSLYTALIEPSSFRQRSAQDRRDGVI